MYHWVEWDMWDKRTRRYAILEKKIVFEKNKKNGSVLVFQAMQNMLDGLQRDIQKWNDIPPIFELRKGLTHFYKQYRIRQHLKFKKRMKLYPKYSVPEYSDKIRLGWDNLQWDEKLSKQIEILHLRIWACINSKVTKYRNL